MSLDWPIETKKLFKMKKTLNFLGVTFILLIITSCTKDNESYQQNDYNKDLKQKLIVFESQFDSQISWD